MKTILVLLLFFLLHRYGAAQNIPSNVVYNVSSSDTKIWVATSKGVATSMDEATFPISYTPKGASNVYASSTTSSVYILSNLDFTISTDEGATWSNTTIPYDNVGDTIGYYGTTTAQRMIPNSSADENRPFLLREMAVHSSSKDIWFATYYGGLRRSKDNGKTRRRIFLPPKNKNALVSTDNLQGLVIGAPTIIRGKTYGDSVHIVKSVLSASNGSVWVGTEDGVCVTQNPSDPNPTWIKYTMQFGGLSSNSVYGVYEQIVNSKSTIWVSCARGINNIGTIGLNYTTDNGKTWKVVLPNTPVVKMAFDNEKIYVLTNVDVQTSVNNGATWTSLPIMQDAKNSNRMISVNAELHGMYLLKKAMNTKLWVSTSDGIAVMDVANISWNILRVDKVVNTQGGEFTYAYPNPFFPDSQGTVRLRYRVISPKAVTITIYDFSMQPVVTLVRNAIRTVGTDYEDTWDGKNSYGSFVANGVYFYKISFENDKYFYGKILVIK